MIFIFRGKRSLLRAFANRIVGAASSGDNTQVAQQAWGIVRVSLCVAGAAFGKQHLVKIRCLECHFARQAQYLVMLQLATLDSTLSHFPL